MYVGIHRFWLFTAFGVIFICYTPFSAYFLELDNHNLCSPSLAHTIHGCLDWIWYTPFLARYFWYTLFLAIQLDFGWYTPHLALNIWYLPVLAISMEFGIYRFWHLILDIHRFWQYWLTLVYTVFGTKYLVSTVFGSCDGIWYTLYLAFQFWYSLF